MRPIRPFRERVYDAASTEAIRREVERLGHVTIDGGDVSSTGGGVHFSVPELPREIWARVYPAGSSGSGASGSGVTSGSGDSGSSGSGSGTSACGPPHSWVEQSPSRGGCFADRNAGLTGDIDAAPAYDPNGSEYAAGTVVRMVPGASWLDGSVVPARHVQEWVIVAAFAGGVSGGNRIRLRFLTGACLLPGEPGGGSGSGVPGG
jgi:hypothetical protein